MNQRLKSGLYSAALLLVIPSPVLAQPHQITWSIIEWAPYTLLRDGKLATISPQLGDGAVDRMMFEMINRLPAYHHRFELSNNQRTWRGMQQGKNLCFASAIKTPERLKFAYFTPAFLGTPMAMVVHQSRKDAIVGNSTSVSLSRVIEQFGTEGRLQDMRSYGPQIDALLEKSPAAVRRERVPTTGFLLRPLSAGIYGFTLEFPAVVEYTRRQGQLSMPVVTVPIDEAPEWLVGYVACTRNAWGKQAIEDIDRAIRKASSAPNYRDAMANWLPADFAKPYKERMRAFYTERSTGGPKVE